MEEKYLRLAIEKSRESLAQGNFPAGAVVVKDGAILSEAVSSPYPGLFHADSKAVQAAFEKQGLLAGATLYVGLEPCLMCLCVAYWAGIREIVYAVPKNKVSSDYYETASDTSNLLTEFNVSITMRHMPEFEQEGLTVIKDWENRRA